MRASDSFLAVGIAAVMLAAAAQAAQPQTAPQTSPAAQLSLSVLQTMDRTVSPCQDFYRYACGGWLNHTQLPPDRSRWSRGFSVIQERNLEVLRDILEQAAAHSGSDPDQDKLGSFYSSCMDLDAIQQAGVKPLRPLLEQIDGVENVETLMRVVGQLHAIGVPVLLEVDVDADFKQPDRNIAQFQQGGLGLPDRDYYLKEDERSQQLRAQYQSHIAKMLTLLGEEEGAASTQASRIFEFETGLARLSWPRAELRDPDETYHKIDLKGLKELAPQLPWSAYLQAIGFPELVDINILVPDFFKGMAQQAAETAPETLRAYLRWQLVHYRARELPQAFMDENFAFFGATLAGQKELPQRWKRCVTATDTALGESLGRLYVERQFPGDSKKIALDMIERIEAAFRAGLPLLDWMDGPTRQRAVEKMEALTNKIGYPNRWRDYSGVQVRASYFDNTLAAVRFEFQRKLNKVGRPVDRSEWEMTPQEVNAFYNPLRNQMVFPAGILQAPFFDRDFPAAMNFGGIGMGMGHELTHGFDDQGRKFDGSGRLTEWWNPEVVESFEQRAQCVEQLYSSYEVQPGVRVNGELTLGENIADLGGIKEAYRAYQAWNAEHGAPPPQVEGLTADQLFFVGFAQGWCMLATPEVERMLVTVDPHSPSKFRVIGPLANFPEFAAAFACEKGTPMNPERRCEVW